jgi:hypothetical protein
MALSGEADGVHAAATAAVVPLLRLAEPAVAAAIKQGLKLLYAAARFAAPLPLCVIAQLSCLLLLHVLALLHNLHSAPPCRAYQGT